MYSSTQFIMTPEGLKPVIVIVKHKTGHSRTSSNPYQSHSSVISPYTTSDMSRYSPRRQDGTSRTYHESNTATNRQYPLSSRSFGTADNSPGKTYKRNTPLTERGSPVSRASSFSAGRTSSSRKNDTAETSGESPAKAPRSSNIPQSSNANRDGTSSIHSRLSSRAHQDTTSSKSDSSYSGEHKQSRSGSDSSLPSPRRKSPEDSAMKRDPSLVGPRSMGRGQSESPSRSSQDSDGNSPSNIPLRTSYRRGLEGEKTSDPAACRLLRAMGRSKLGSGRPVIGSSEFADAVSTRTTRDSKLPAQKDPSTNFKVTTQPTDAPSLPKDETFSDSIQENECSDLTVGLKTGSKTDNVSKAVSPPRTDPTSPRQSFDRGDIKYNSCRSRIPTPNSPSGSRKESPVRQKLSSHSFSGSRTTESGNANNDEAGSSKNNSESRADRIARYKELRRRELASKMKSKMDPETTPEPEEAPSEKSEKSEKSEERSKSIKSPEVTTESSTASKTSANRSATTDSTKIICGMKVSKNIAERAKKRQERMLRNRQHLSAEVIGRNARIGALCIKPETSESTNSQKEPDSLSLRTNSELSYSQNKNQLQPSPLQDMESLSPSSLSLSDTDRDSLASDISPADKRLSVTDLESLPEFTSEEEMNLDADDEYMNSEKRVSVTELVLSQPGGTSAPNQQVEDEEMVSSEKRVSVTELVLSRPEDVSTQCKQVKSIGSPPEEKIVETKPRSLDFSKTIPQERKRTLEEDKSSNLSRDKDTQHRYPATSPRNLSSSSSEKTVQKVISPPRSSIHDSDTSRVTSVLPDHGKKEVTKVEAGNYDSVSKTAVKISQAKDISSSYASSSIKSEPYARRSSGGAVSDKQLEEHSTHDKNRPRPPPSTVLYTKKLLETGKKDQKRVDYDLQKELDWLERRKYQYDEEMNEEKEKKLSVLEMVRAAESNRDNDDEKPRKPLVRTMSEARGKDEAQSRKEILASRISNLGRTRSFGVGSLKRSDISTSLDLDLPPINRDNHLDELLMKNVAYLDDENLPTEPLVRSLHPGENSKLRKSLRKKKVAKLSSLPEKGVSEDNRSNENVAEESGTTGPSAEVTSSRATLKLAPAPRTVQSSHARPVSVTANVPDPQSVTEPVTQTVISSVTPKPLQVTQKPARPTLVQNRPPDSTPKQLPVTQPPVTKPVSPTVVPAQVSVTSQKQLNLTQPPVKNAVSPTVVTSQVSGTTQKQSHVTQSPIKKAVSPTRTQHPVKKAVSPTRTQPPVRKVASSPTKTQPPVKKTASSPTRTQQPIKKAVSPTRTQAPIKKAVSPTRTQQPIKKAVSPTRTQQPIKKAVSPTRTQQPIKKAVSPTRTQAPVKKAASSPTRAQPPVKKVASSPTKTQPPVKTVASSPTKTQPPVKKVVSPTAQPATKKIVSPTAAQSQSVQSPVAQHPVAQVVSPTAVATKELPSLEGSVDGPHRKRVRSRSAARPPVESAVDIAAKKRRERSAPRKAPLETLEERSVTKGRDPNKDIPSSGPTATEKSTAVICFEKSNATPRGKPPTPEGTAPPRRARQRVKPEDIPAPILDVIKASLDYDQNGTQSKAEPCPPAQVRQTKPPTCVSVGKPTVLNEPLAPIKPTPDDIQAYSPVVTRRLSDSGRSTITTVNQYQMNEDNSVTVDGPVPGQSLKPRTDSLDSDSNIRMESIMENNNSSKLPFDATEPIASEPVYSQVRKLSSGTIRLDDGQTQKILFSEVEKPKVPSTPETKSTSHTSVSSVYTTGSKTITSSPEVRKLSVTSAGTVTPAGVKATTPAITATTTVGPEIRRPSQTSAQVTSPVRIDPVTLTTASVTLPASKAVTTVTSKASEVKPVAVVTSAPHVKSAVSSTPLATVASPRVTSAPQTSVSSVTSSQSVALEVKKPAVTQVTAAPVKSVISSTPATATPGITSAAVTSAPTTTTKAPVTAATRVTSTISSTPVTTTAGVTSPVVTPASTTSMKAPSVAATTRVTTMSSTPVTTTAGVTSPAVTPASTTSMKAPSVTATTRVTTISSTPVTTTAGVTSPVTPASTTSMKAPSVTATTRVTSTISSTPVTATAGVISPAVTPASTISMKAPSVTATTRVTTISSTPVTATAGVTSPAVAPASTTSMKAPSVTATTRVTTISSTPVTATAGVTSPAVTPASTTSMKAPSVTAATRVTSTVNTTPVTTTGAVKLATTTSTDLTKTPTAAPVIRVTSSTPVSGSPTVTTKTSAGFSTEEKKPADVTSSASVTKTEPVTSAVKNVTQTSSIASSKLPTAPRAASLSPTRMEDYDLSRSMELTQKDIENGNLMTRSANFSHQRKSEGSLIIPRRGILKRNGSLRNPNANSELIDPELAKVFQARRIKEKSENPNGDLTEEDAVFDDQFQRQDSLLSEIINEDDESEEQRLSVAARISQMETRISVSTSGCATPKTPRSRLGSVPRTLPENGNKKSVLPQEELFNRLTDLARSKEASQESQKRYKRSRDDWRTRTQPVTLKEVEQADSLESVISFRALVMRRSSINIFETLEEQDKRRRKAGRKTEYPQPYLPEKRNRKNDPRYKTLPVTAAELMDIPEGEPISLELLKSKMQALKESKSDSGIVSSGSDIEKESQGSDSIRSLTTVTDEDDEFSQMSVAARASLFRQMEEKCKKSASGAKRYIDRKRRERSRTVPITEEEVTKAAEIVEEEASSRKSSLTITDEEQAIIQKHLDAIDEQQVSPDEEKGEESGPAFSLEKLIQHDLRGEEKDEAKHSDELARQTLADKVKLFSSEKEKESENEKSLRATDAPVIRRRNRRFASRFNTQAHKNRVSQPITSEEMENVFRISPLAISLVKPPDPDILKGLPLNAQREFTAQYAEACLSQQGSRAGSRANSRPGSQAGSRRGSLEESEESKAETKGILKMADYQKDLQQVKSILKTESGRESPEREIKSILKPDGERNEPPSRSILKQDSNEQVKVESETRSILKSSEPEPRRSSKQLDSEPKSILKLSDQDVNATVPKASEPRSVLKKDSSWEKNEEPRGILKKESSFDYKKEPEKGVLKHLDAKEITNQRGILKKELSIENINSSEDSDISDLAAQSEEPKIPMPEERKKKEKRRGLDERYLTQPVTDVEKKSPESPRKQQRYTNRHHKTQPVTPEEKKEASQVIQPVIKMSGSLAERLQALQKSGEEDWKKRITKTNSASPSPDRELRSSYSPESTPVRPVNLSERMSLLKSSQSSWRNRVEESDAKAFTVEGKLNKSGQIIRERTVVTKLKQGKSTETDQTTGATSPSTPTKGDWKIPIPTEIIASETTVIEETTENSTTIVKLPELKDDGLDQFFSSSTTNLFEKTELDISVDDFDEIFQTSKNILIHSVKSRPKKKVQARSKNPLKSRSANLERHEYEEFKTNIAEIELKRKKKEELSKDAGFAEAALAGLASKENFSKIELRKTDISSPSPGGHRYIPYKPLMLLHVKGRRHIQTRLVEPCARNVNQGDCYILVTSDKVINWIGEYSNIIEKAKSADIAAHIQQKKDMGYKSSNGIITIDSRVTSGSLFWSLLEGHESECQECGGADEDEIYENAIISTNMIYKIEKNMLVPWEEYWGVLPKHEMLKNNQVYVYDFGAEIYVWQGKKATPQKRKLGLELAQQLWDKGYNYEMSNINPLSPLHTEEGMRGASGQRPPWALIAKVNENMETVLFREKFADWPDSARLIKVKTVDSNSNKTENGGDLIPYDAQKLIDKEPPEALLMTLDGSQVGRGRYWSEDMGGFIQEFEINTVAVTVWHILEFDHYKLEPLSNGQFHEGDTYVVRWEYRIIATGTKASARRPVGRERCAYFFWQGQTSTITEKGASALMTVELDEERGPQVRVLQGKEPPCFLNLFQGQMVVHIGKREEEETNTQGVWRFYSVHHEKSNETCLIEIQAHISSLRSRSSFILFNVQNGKVFIWHGVKSPQNTRTSALAAVNSIQERHPLEMGLPENVNVIITEINEGSEKPEFWMALRSRDRSEYTSLLNDPRSYNFSLRLFQFTSVSGVIDVTEFRNPTISSDSIAPYPFLQSDLYKVSQPALFLLDYGYEVYLWQGWWPEGDDDIENVLTGSAQARLMVERRCAMQTALDYCQAKNLSVPIKPYLVYAGLEPLKFINIFPFWSIDEIVKELQIKDGKSEEDMVSVEDELNRLSLVRYSFKELLERPLPEDADPLKLESYLSDEEFEEVLKMSKDEYYSLPAWKQSKLKQDLGLF